jgi:predicted polyphosphate/ATP-dependent NAD kinase
MMGEDEARNCCLDCSVIGERKKETTSKDTEDVARRIAEEEADLLVFCGGDGTARDVLRAVNANLPVLGIPTGVKMHSAVFAVGPRAGANIALEFLFGEMPLREAEVMDVDEVAFREGRVSAKLYGYMLSPYEPHLVQGMKLATPMTESELRNQAAIAVYIIEKMKTDVVYVVGPGTTTGTIGALLDAKKSLLGVDLFLNKKLMAVDVNEEQILDKIKRRKAQIIVTPIGGQGFIFGRGNQQISPQVIRHVGIDNVVVVATRSKVQGLKNLRVDTGDPDLDEMFRMLKLKVITDYNTEHAMRVE